GIDPASLPGAVKPQPPSQPQPAKRTMMGMGLPTPGRPDLGYAATTQLPAATVPKPKAQPQQATMMAAAPAITQQPRGQPPQYEGNYQQGHQPPQYQQQGYTAPVGAGPPKTAPMAAVVPEAVPYEET